MANRSIGMSLLVSLCSLFFVSCFTSFFSLSFDLVLSRIVLFDLILYYPSRSYLLSRFDLVHAFRSLLVSPSISSLSFTYNTQSLQCLVSLDSTISCCSLAMYFPRRINTGSWAHSALTRKSSRVHIPLSLEFLRVQTLPLLGFFRLRLPSSFTRLWTCPLQFDSTTQPSILFTPLYR